MQQTTTIAMIAGLGLATVACGQVIGFSGDPTASAEQTGAMFSGNLEYTYLGGNDGQLSIDLTNDSPLAVGGFLTGLIFRAAAGDDPLIATLGSSNPATFLDTGPALGGGFGSFDGGAALGGNFLGGGTPSDGLGLGDMGMFTFDISSADASTLTSSSFLGTADQPGLLVRFRGLNGGLSDMVPVVIPAPSALALLGLGGLAATRRRR
ncbi:MAG: PEP-CTERM sorting domain-containing protein [Phycisphaerales bacterium JB060]